MVKYIAILLLAGCASQGPDPCVLEVQVNAHHVRCVAWVFK